MDAHVRFPRRLLVAGFLALAGCETMHPGQPAAGSPESATTFRAWPPATDPSDNYDARDERARRQAAYKARGQAPDGPKPPDSLPPIAEPPPSTLPPPAQVPATPVSFSSTPAAAPITDLLRDKQVEVAAYIGTDAVITADEVWQMVRQRGKDFATLSGAERDAKEKEVFREELRKLIERELVIVELTDRLKKNKRFETLKEIQEHAGKTADERMREYRKANKFASEEEFIAVLRAQGLSYKGIRRQLERDALAGVFLQGTIKDKLKFITLNDVWDYYQGNAKEFAVEDGVKWLDLFVAFNRFPSEADAKRYADAAWRAAAGGSDFARLVKQYGQGDSNLRDGEGVGRKRGEVQPPELEKVIFEMEAGQVSALLQTATGYHIVKVAERSKAGVKPFDQGVQTDIREKLSRQVQKQETEKIVDELWRKYRPKVVE